jgi:hypothetical protein
MSNGCVIGMDSDPLHSEDFHKLLKYFRTDRYQEGGV